LFQFIARGDTKASIAAMVIYLVPGCNALFFCKGIKL
jgi:hypothetical protein